MEWFTEKELKQSFLVTTLFTLADYLVHYSIDFLKITYYPPIFGTGPLEGYAIGKFIFTFMALLLLLRFFKELKTWQLTSIIVATLEIRYLSFGTEYYTTTFHIANLIMHFIFLYSAIYLIEKKKVLI